MEKVTVAEIDQQSPADESSPDGADADGRDGSTTEEAGFGPA